MTDEDFEHIWTIIKYDSDDDEEFGTPDSFEEAIEILKDSPDGLYFLQRDDLIDSTYLVEQGVLWVTPVGTECFEPYKFPEKKQ